MDGDCRGFEEGGGSRRGIAWGMVRSDVAGREEEEAGSRGSCLLCTSTL